MEWTCDTDTAGNKAQDASVLPAVFQPSNAR